MHVASISARTPIDMEKPDIERDKARYIIQNSLAIRAWRRQKEENRELKYNVKLLTEKAEALQLQKFALRQLLDAEKIRLAIMNNDLHKVLSNLEDCKQEKNAIIKEKEELENQMKALEEKMTEMENQYHNQKNDLLTAKVEARGWEKQLEKEREKLSKKKSEKKLSIEDVQEVSEDAKDTNSPNNRKIQRDSRIKNIPYRNTKKNSTRPGRDVGKVDFGKNITK